MTVEEERTEPTKKQRQPSGLPLLCKEREKGLRHQDRFLKLDAKEKL